MSDMPSHRLLTTPEAAAYLGVKPGTLADWRWRGGGPPYRKIGKKAIRYALEDLEAWVLSHPLQQHTATDRLPVRLLPPRDSRT